MQEWDSEHTVTYHSKGGLQTVPSLPFDKALASAQSDYACVQLICVGAVIMSSAVSYIYCCRYTACIIYAHIRHYSSEQHHHSSTCTQR